MRELTFAVPSEHGARVSELARGAGATHTLRLPARGSDGQPQELLVLHLPNDRFDAVLDAVDGVPGLRVTFQRDSVVQLEPPPEGLPEQVTDVSSRGPLEILVEGLQSLGAWPPFLVYSAIAGAVVWAGLVSDTVFLLTAAMLIAPYAAPAMSTALATARGDLLLLRRSVGRYLVSVGTTAGTAALLTWGSGESAVTDLMLEVADVSALSVLLPACAGVVGAVSFARADRTGIVSGAGIGMLVALALAPQAGLLGVGAVLGEPRILASAAFLAALQLVGINVAATLVFVLLGVRQRIPRARDGSALVSAVSLLVTVGLLAGMLVLQWQSRPELARETVTSRARAIALEVLDEVPGVVGVEATARFPTSDDVSPDVYVVRVHGTPVGDDAPDRRVLVDRVAERLRRELPDAHAIVEVSLSP